MTDPTLATWLARMDARIAQLIRTYGWAVEAISPVEDDQPPFAYTVGLFGLGHPELVMVGAALPTARAVLNDLGARVRSGADLAVGALIAFDSWPHRVVLEELPNPGEIVFAANRHYRRPPDASVPALQVSYDDLDGRFPWEPGYAAPARQPRPGTWRA